MTHLVDIEVKVMDFEIFLFKFLVKVFISLYLLNLLMDQVDTLHIGRYLSEVLCCTITAHLGDLEVKVNPSYSLPILHPSPWAGGGGGGGGGGGSDYK